jgi:predicted PurR-regulated permease PerM
VDYIKDFFEKEVTKKIIAILVLILFFYIMRSMLNIFLLTFLFSYIMYSFQRLLLIKIKILEKVNKTLLTVIQYIIFFIVITLFIYQYIPAIINQGVAIINEIKEFNVATDLNFIPQGMKDYIMPTINQIDVPGYTKVGINFLVSFLKNIGTVSLNVFIALILSLFFMIERDKVKKFASKFGGSKVSSVYSYIKYFGRNFINSFGKVMQAQILIAFINSILSMIALAVMNFPQLLGLGMMIFIFSLVPVAGTMLSLIPLSIIAFNIGGVKMILYVLIMIAVLHALESYVLNPKLMSAKTELPVFFVFIILIVSEHFMGVWGLLIGIPLFIFILDILNINLSE